MAQDPNAEPEVNEERELRAATLFDIRRIIGGLFLLYGITLTVLGPRRLRRGPQARRGRQRQPVVGITLLVMAAMFIGWALCAPAGARAGQAATR